jgi:hypothetical protein
MERITYSLKVNINEIIAFFTAKNPSVERACVLIELGGFLNNYLNRSLSQEVQEVVCFMIGDINLNEFLTRNAFFTKIENITMSDRIKTNTGIYFFPCLLEKEDKINKTVTSVLLALKKNDNAKTEEEFMRVISNLGTQIFDLRHSKMLSKIMGIMNYVDKDVASLVEFYKRVYHMCQ